ncbi:MAG: WD40 repeat domain-containing protein [Candidatus Bipolaricaulaceae bacterium]
MAFSSDGAMLAVGTSSGVDLRDGRSLALVALLIGHTGSVCAAEFFPDGKLLASGSADGTVLLWDVSSLGQ